MPYVKGAVAHGVVHVADVYHSPNVYANFVNVALWNDAQGAEAAVLAAINAPEYVFESIGQEATEGEATDPAAVDAAQRDLVNKGLLSQADLDKGNTAGNNPNASDPNPGVLNTGTDPGAATISSDIDATVLYSGPIGTGSELRTVTITVGNVTKTPGVIFPYDVATIAPQNGLTVQEVCDNLKALIVNIWVPLKTEFPDAFITCSFRKGGVGSPTSQHPRGMAMDIQYSKIGSWTGTTKNPYPGPDSYFTRAQWIRDNLPYDQFLLEYKTTGTKKPWHHISFKKNGNRAQVCTFMNDKNCKGPGVQGLFDLSNA
jgi:hypothetical protein